MATAEPTECATRNGGPDWYYRGRDDGGQELEVIAVDTTSGVLVIHAMPTTLNKGKTSKKMKKRNKRKGRR
jgi:hypothetical protein